MENDLNFLSTRSGFNIALKHFKTVTTFINRLEKRQNLADLINNYLDEKKITQYQISSILNALLIEKYNYLVKSINLKKTIAQNLLIKITNTVSDWDLFDIIISYHHPQLGQIIINPKNADSWSAIDNLKENELAVFYIGNFSADFDENLAEKCAAALENVFYNNKVNQAKLFKSSNQPSRPVKKEKKPVKKEEKPAPNPPPKPVLSPIPNSRPAQKTGGKKKLSPRYGVLVSNELFHNGNVEAWKKIILSYETKYPGIKVLVFYEGEQIHDINTLFKWGKVKHGTNIYFALLGSDFADISKLRRYLAQGASPRFEDFLRGDPTKVLTLF